MWSLVPNQTMQPTAFRLHAAVIRVYDEAGNLIESGTR
jgi:hypothetical protein